MRRVNHALLLNTIGLIITSAVLVGQRYINIPDSVALIACCIALVCIIAGIVISVRTMRQRRR